MGHLIQFRTIIDNAAKRGYVALTEEQKDMLRPYADNIDEIINELQKDSEDKTGILGIIQGAVADNLSNWMEVVRGALFSYSNPGRAVYHKVGPGYTTYRPEQSTYPQAAFRATLKAPGYTFKKPR